VAHSDFHRNCRRYTIRIPFHPASCVFASSIPSLIHRFISRRSADSASALVLAPMLRGIPSEPADPLFPLSRRSDRHLACNRCGFAAPGRRLFIDSAVLPASRMFAIAWANTCALRACVRACGRQRIPPTVRSTWLPRAQGDISGVIYRGSFRRLLLCSGST